tara:strand:+ start:1665 stop:2402 length:738 start_codon:yes stop_codon:yes gene_type:complete
MKKLFLFFILAFILPSVILGQVPDALSLDLQNLVKPENFSRSINVLLTFASLGLIPFVLVSTTSFLRIIIVFSLMRQALGTGQSPPNTVIISLAIFMTVFIMTPTWNSINTSALNPYYAGKINQKEAISLAIEPIQQFMLKLTREKDLELFLRFSQLENVSNVDEVPIWITIPAFLISELKSAFQISFLLFIPFVVVDLIVSNILLALGMFMLSPALVSLPFKILLFVLADGWNLLTQGLLLSFQ